MSGRPRTGPSRRTQVRPPKYGCSAGIAAWSASSVRGWIRTTRLIVRSTAKASSRPAAWSYDRRIWIPPKARTAIERERRQSSRPEAPARQPDPDQDDGQQLGDEVAARQDDVEGDQEADGDPGRPSAARRGDARPAARPEHEDERERRHRDAQDLDRQAGQLGPGAGDVAGQERESDADEGRRDQGEPEGRETADDPRPKGDRLGGVGGSASVAAAGGADAARRRASRSLPATARAKARTAPET